MPILRRRKPQRKGGRIKSFSLKVDERTFLEAEKEGSSREFFFKLLKLLSNGSFKRSYIKSLPDFEVEKLIIEIVKENGLEPYFDIKGSRNIYNALRKALRAKFQGETEKVWEGKLSNWRAEFEHKLKLATKRYYIEAGGRENVRRLYGRGWIVPSYIAKKGEVDVDGLCREEFLKERLSLWLSSPAFKRREKVLRDTIKAYLLDCVELSIYSLFAQIEGVIWDFFVRGNVLEADIEALIKKRNRKFVTVQYALKVILEEIFGTDVGIPKFLDWVKFIEFRDDGTLNRHAVQHGISVKFGTKENFLRLFLLLDFLYEVFSYSKS